MTDYGEPWKCKSKHANDPRAYADLFDAKGRELIASWIAGDDGPEGKMIDTLIDQTQSRWSAGAMLNFYAQRIVACVNACQGIPTEWLEQFGRSALVRSIHLVPADKVGGVAEVLSGPLKPSEQVVRIDVCPHCKGIRPVIADQEDR